MYSDWVNGTVLSCRAILFHQRTRRGKLVNDTSLELLVLHTEGIMHMLGLRERGILTPPLGSGSGKLARFLAA